MVVGAGPVGLSLAIDLALRGVPSVVLEADTSLRAGSRAICYAKRSLEILDRLGVGQRMLDKGVTWQRGKVFWRDRTVYEFDLQPEAGHRMPAFVNLQQSYLEGYLIERAQELAVDLRFGHRVSGVVARDDGASLEISTPSGAYALSCDWLLACDGARSTVRHALGLAFEGRVFRDRFLITDVRMEADLPARALVLVRPAVPPRPVGAAAPAAGQCLADRSAARSRRRPAGRGQARAGDPAAEGDAGRRTGASRSNGSASTPSSAGAWRGFAMAA